MTLACFRAEPREGHLDSCKIVVSYLAKFKWATIKIRTEEPDMSSVPTTPCDWEESFCGKVKELIPHIAPAPLGKHEVTISYHDDNRFYNFITGQSVVGVLHILNKTHIDWHSNNQSTVEIATHSSECLSS